jgi:hypothetical protein
MKKFFDYIKFPLSFILAIISYKIGLEEDYAMFVEERADAIREDSWTTEKEETFQRSRKEALRGLGKRKVAYIDRCFGVVK